VAPRHDDVARLTKAERDARYLATEKGREQNRRRVARQRARRVAAGLCGRCGKVRAPSAAATVCQACADYLSILNADKKIAKYEEELRDKR
jgi:hypothetical protein